MSKYVSLDKRSKKQQKEYHSKQRRTWGELNPVTRSVPNGKAYNRKKEKERISKEFRDGFGADSFLLGSKSVFTNSEITYTFLLILSCNLCSDRNIMNSSTSNR